MTGKELQAEFGGVWDGAGREIHGILERGGRKVKIELLRTSLWACSVFEGGSCVGSARSKFAREAVAGALAAADNTH